MPFWPARMMAGSASAMAVSAALRLPVAIASSTLRTAVRRRERRALLITVRRAIWRAAYRGRGQRRQRAGPETGMAALSDTAVAHGLIARTDRGAVGGRERRERRRYAGPLRIIVNMGEQRLDAGYQLFAVEQLADRDGLVQRRHVARTIGTGT